MLLYLLFHLVYLMTPSLEFVNSDKVDYIRLQYSGFVCMPSGNLTLRSKRTHSTKFLINWTQIIARNLNELIPDYTMLAQTFEVKLLFSDCAIVIKLKVYF